MPMTSLPTRSRVFATGEGGFTMLVAIGVMLVTSLLLVAAFTAANTDVHLSRGDTSFKQAYFAARTGIQEYEYKLQATPNYWQLCEKPKGTVSGESNATWEVKPLPATGQSACSTASPFSTMIESSGANANTFRVESTGVSHSHKQSIVATFKVNGFLDYVYFTQYEDEDPTLSGESPSRCERYYYEEKSIRSNGCGNITFTTNDSVHGPMHTDDSALVECSNKVFFGREGQTPPDRVEINGGMWSQSKTKPTEKNTEQPCSASNPVINTESEKYEVGPELHPPPSDTSLRAYVESGYEFTGLTSIVLKGEKLEVENNGNTKTIAWPANGLIFVSSGEKGCSYEYSQNTGGSDTTTTKSKEAECGSVYVEGNYKKSLTIGAETDLTINGSITQTGVTAGSPPTGTATLGLMATRFVRVYHPCSSFGGNTQGYLQNPWIYAAILSTSHSFAVDNDACGNQMGKLSVYGAIGQKFRGVVGTVGNSGYIKNYNYDERLATDEPPYFLAPLDAGWQVARETAPKAG